MTNIPPPQFFSINLEGANLLHNSTAPYTRLDNTIQLPRDAVCSITASTFEELQNEHLNHNPPIPTLLAYIQDAHNSAFFDAAGAAHWLERRFTNPNNRQAAEKIYLFIQRDKNSPFSHLISCAGSLSRQVKNASLAFSLENSLEARDSRLNYLFDLAAEPYFPQEQDITSLAELALQQDPQNVFALTTLSDQLCHGRGAVRNIRRAHELAERAVGLSPFNAQALAILGEILRVGGEGVAQNVPEAKRLLKKAFFLDPNSAFTLSCLGRLYLSGGPGVEKNVQTALFLLERARDILPNDPSTLALLGNLYRTGSPPDSLEVKRAKNKNMLPLLARQEAERQHTWRERQRANPLAGGVIPPLDRRFSNLEYDDGRGVLQDLHLAHILLERFVQLNPNMPFATASLGLLYCHETMRNLPRARELYDQAQTFRDPDPKTVAIIAELEGALKIQAQRQANIVQKTVTKLALMNPSLISVSTHPGQLAEDHTFALIEAARPSLDTALLLDPQNILACKLGGELYFNGPQIQANITRAQELWEKVIQAEPNNVAILAKLGMLYFQSGPSQNLQRAKTLFEQAQAKDPECLPASAHLGALALREALLEHKNAAPEKDLLEKVLQKDPHCVVTLLHLGLLSALGTEGIPKDITAAKDFLEQAFLIKPIHESTLLTLEAFCQALKSRESEEDDVEAFGQFLRLGLTERALPPRYFKRDVEPCKTKAAASACLDIEEESSTENSEAGNPKKVEMPISTIEDLPNAAIADSFLAEAAE